MMTAQRANTTVLGRRSGMDEEFHTIGGTLTAFIWVPRVSLGAPTPHAQLPNEGVMMPVPSTDTTRS